MQSIIIRFTSVSRVIPQSLSARPAPLGIRNKRARSLLQRIGVAHGAFSLEMTLFAHKAPPPLPVVKTFQHVPSLAMLFLETRRRQAEESLIGGQTENTERVFGVAENLDSCLSN